MSFFWLFTYTMVIMTLGYMLGRSDGKVEGRIETFQEMR